MRFQHPDGTTVHLAYCANVHPTDSLEGVLAQLDRYAAPIREHLGADRLGIGLWLAREVATALVEDPAALARLRHKLTVRGLEVVTLNGFPYTGFGDPVVKHRVYRPDWSEPSRLAYTLDLARILAELLPEDAARGSVSTLPLGWRTRMDEPGWHDAVFRNIAVLDHSLGELSQAIGRPIRVAFEPEPGCVVENTDEAVEHVGRFASEHVGLCLDACHLAVAHESPQATLASLREAGIDVVKLQASAALTADDPRSPETAAALAAYAEPRFLHQTREPVGDGVRGTDDLPEAAAELPGDEAWRVHFHVPLHREIPSPLGTTVPVLSQTLDALFGGPRALTDHIEVETYTWPVLPGAADIDLPAAIAGELAWTSRALTSLGLKEIS
jgi:sugar phosphate isomerase/epimerase